MQEMAEKMLAELTAAGYCGVVVLGKGGSDEVKLAVNGSARQIGMLLGIADKSLMRALELDDYKEYFAGYREGSEYFGTAEF